MTNTLASIFARMSHGDAITKAESIIKALVPLWASLEPWSPLIPNLVQLQAVAQRFRSVHDLAETGSFVKIAERNALRPELNQVMTDMGDFMEIAARKDPTLLMRTCFDVRQAKKTPAANRAAGLSAPDSFTVKHGGERGMLIGKASRVQKARSYEVHVAYGDPVEEANWVHHSTHGTCSEMIMKDFEPGKNVYLRARAIGSKSCSPWSHFVTIMPI